MLVNLITMPTSDPLCVFDSARYDHEC